MLRLRLDDYTALVVGAASSLGAATARSLLGTGCRLVLADTGLSPDHALRTELGSGEMVRYIDCASAAVADEIFAQVADCDILIHAHRGECDEQVLEASDDSYRNHYDRTVVAPVRIARHYLAGMLARNRGRILFTARGHPFAPAPLGAPHAIAAYAQLSFVRTLAEATRGSAVTVNTLIVGREGIESGGAFLTYLASPLASATNGSVLQAGKGLIHAAA